MKTNAQIDIDEAISAGDKKELNRLISECKFNEILVISKLHDIASNGTEIELKTLIDTVDIDIFNLVFAYGTASYCRQDILIRILGDRIVERLSQ